MTKVSVILVTDLHVGISFPQLLVGAEQLLDLTFVQGATQVRHGRSRRAGSEERPAKSWAEQLLERKEEMAQKAGGDMAYRVPRRDDRLMGWCRECGGPVTAADSWAAVETRRGLNRIYGPKWRDEGLVLSKQSTCICGACRTLRTSDRGWSHPAAGQALLVFPGVGMKLGLKLALEKIRDGEVGVPYCLVVGDSRRKNPQHIYRFVPVNWSVSDRVDAYCARVGEYAPIAFRVRPVLAFVEGWTASGSGLSFAEFYKAAEEKKLTPSERLVARRILFDGGAAGSGEDDETDQ